MRGALGTGLTLAATLVASTGAGAATLEQVGTYTSPVYVTSHPTDPDRLYVVEQGGTVKLTRPTGTSTFLDISALVGVGGERGLLSIALAPDFATSGLLYVFYTDLGGDLQIEEYRASGDVVDLATRRPLLTIEHSQFSNHNGGALQFGPDGHLYATTGDGGGGGDPLENAQDVTELLGKVLRIDPRPSGTSPYSIPPGNPFAGTADDPVPGARDEIWSYGLRNPWRLSFDRITGALALGDVGQSAWEEIDYARPPSAGRAANFGWDCREGMHVFEPAGCPTPDAFTDPIFEYANDPSTCAITGGYVVRDLSLGDLYGRYLYIDFCAGQLRSLVPSIPLATGDRPEGLSVSSPTSFGEDAACGVYVVSRAGPVYRLVGAGEQRCAGTSLARDIVPGAGSSAPAVLTDVDGALFFRNSSDGELWRSNGTAAGTFRVADIAPGPSGSSPAHLTDLDGTLVLAADDGTRGEELWRSDGTPGGTTLVRDIASGAASSAPRSLTAVGETLFFTADDGTSGRELWRSDGTQGGTTLVRDIAPGAASSTPLGFTAVGDTIFFTADDGTRGRELWRTDGTAAGTALVRQIVDGPEGPAIRGLTASGGSLFFTAVDGVHGRELWRSDGTAAGTSPVRDIVSGPAGSLPIELTDLDGTLLFSAIHASLGRELWRSDGTVGGTRLVRDISAGSADSSPRGLTAVAGRLFLVADDGSRGAELWRSDGTAGGTRLVRDIVAGADDADPRALTGAGTTLFFTAADPARGRELWRSDGTAGGTRLDKDILPGPGGSRPSGLAAVGWNLFFSADDGARGRELWRASR